MEVGVAYFTFGFLLSVILCHIVVRYQVNDVEYATSLMCFGIGQVICLFLSQYVTELAHKKWLLPTCLVLISFLLINDITGGLVLGLLRPGRGPSSPASKTASSPVDSSPGTSGLSIPSWLEGWWSSEKWWGPPTLILNDDDPVTPHIFSLLMGMLFSSCRSALSLLVRDSERIRHQKRSELCLLLCAVGMTCGSVLYRLPLGVQIVFLVVASAAGGTAAVIARLRYQTPWIPSARHSLWLDLSDRQRCGSDGDSSTNSSTEQSDDDEQSTESDTPKSGTPKRRAVKFPPIQSRSIQICKSVWETYTKARGTPRFKISSLAAAACAMLLSFLLWAPRLQPGTRPELVVAEASGCLVIARVSFIFLRRFLRNRPYTPWHQLPSEDQLALGVGLTAFGIVAFTMAPNSILISWTSMMVTCAGVSEMELLAHRRGWYRAPPSWFASFESAALVMLPPVVGTLAKICTLQVACVLLALPPLLTTVITVIGHYIMNSLDQSSMYVPGGRYNGGRCTGSNPSSVYHDLESFSGPDTISFTSPNE
ncbi:putative transmembrane protein [Gregarina niphandrodes]|uniref:Transmembrane protein n=1 Tax=Gregarina niphandrodes TaxID=110365 RepID=A0A023B3X7_GRENI|nr:putative transmembrane protein [Gregarina niphandrodes]EZG55999.1 putative transmembrane protein [Gregarina niphandrodes]|eukprot:XP_011131387.1 putative transmembrane protein [Gregarina niphandrodes]